MPAPAPRTRAIRIGSNARRLNLVIGKVKLKQSTPAKVKSQLCHSTDLVRRREIPGELFDDNFTRRKSNRFSYQNRYRWRKCRPEQFDLVPFTVHRSRSMGQTNQKPAYLALANSLEVQIQADVFRPGDRLPSVRSLCGDHRLSIETVLHTLRVLEDRGIVEARPRSGFYIKSRNQLPEPSPQHLRLEASPVEVGKLRYQSFSAGSSKNVVPLSVAVPAPEVLPTAKLGRMISVIARSASAEVVGYAEAAGHPKLRKQLARRASDWGCLLTSDEFIVTNGTAEAIALSLRATCPPDSAVLVESPTFYDILETIENLGLRVVELPTDPRTGVSPDDVERAMLSIPRIGACLLVTNYCNPLGGVMPVEEKKRLVSILAKYQVQKPIT
jgi:DNA-binding transcriptional MocR family regulator